MRTFLACLLLLLLTCSGYTQTSVEYHTNNTKAAEGNLVNGKKQGFWKYWNNEGKLVSTKNYRNDTLNGLTLYYDKRGKLEFTESYQAGVLLNRGTYHNNGLQNKVYFYAGGTKKSEIVYGDPFVVTSYWNEKGMLTGTDSSKAVGPQQSDREPLGEQTGPGKPEDEYMAGERTIDPEHIYEMPDELAQFPGGKEAMLKYFKEHLQYPDEGSKEYTGKIYLGFVVNRDGSIEQLTVKKGLYEPLDKAAIRMAEKMPPWIPSRIKKQAVRSYMVVPVIISM